MGIVRASESLKCFTPQAFISHPRSQKGYFSSSLFLRLRKLNPPETKVPTVAECGAPRTGKSGGGSDSSLPFPRQVPRAPGGGSGRVTRPWRGRLLLCCLPAGESRRRGREPPDCSLALSQGLLGKQESQAQLIKLWVEATPNWGIQYPQKPWLLALLRLQCRPSCEQA